MTVSTIEGIVENGQIRLREDVSLPERTKVFVVIPDFEAIPHPRIFSPRLAHPHEAGEFAKQVIERGADADI